MSNDEITMDRVEGEFFVVFKRLKRYEMFFTTIKDLSNINRQLLFIKLSMQSYQKGENPDFSLLWANGKIIHLGLHLDRVIKENGLEEKLAEMGVSPEEEFIATNPEFE